MNIFVRKFPGLPCPGISAFRSGGAQAQTPRVDRIHIIEAGIYRAEITKKIPTAIFRAGTRTK